MDNRKPRYVWQPQKLGDPQIISNAPKALHFVVYATKKPKEALEVLLFMLLPYFVWQFRTCLSIMIRSNTGANCYGVCVWILTIALMLIFNTEACWWPLKPVMQPILPIVLAFTGFEGTLNAVTAFHSWPLAIYTVLYAVKGAYQIYLIWFSKEPTNPNKPGTSIIYNRFFAHNKDVTEDMVRVMEGVTVIAIGIICSLWIDGIFGAFLLICGTCMLFEDIVAIQHNKSNQPMSTIV